MCTCTFFGGGIEAKSDSSSSLGIAAELRAVTMAAAQVSIREFLWWKTLRLARKRSAFSVVFQWGRSISPLKRLCCYWYKTIFCTIFQNRQASIIPSISFLGGFHRKRGFWYIENIAPSPCNFKLFKMITVLPPIKSCRLSITHRTFYNSVQYLYVYKEHKHKGTRTSI